MLRIIATMSSRRATMEPWGRRRRPSRPYAARLTLGAALDGRGSEHEGDDRPLLVDADKVLCDAAVALARS
jgi:hypothetical protein